MSLRFDLAELSAAERYKLLGGLIVPRPIALVTSQSAKGHINAAPFSFFNVFAEEPPLVMLGLGLSPLGGRQGHHRQHPRHRQVRDQPGRRGDRPGHEPVRDRLPARENEIEVAGLDLAPSDKVAAPRIVQAPVNLECRRYVTLQPARGRYLVLGEVMMAHVRDGVIDPAALRVDRAAYAPIGRLFGGGYVRTHDRFEMPGLT